MPIEHIRVLRGADGDSVELLEAPSSPPPWDDDQAFVSVGRPSPRVEGFDKVTGRARYAGDQCLPGQLYAAVLRCPHPHARLRRIDGRRAETLAGVHAVLSAANAPSIDWYGDSRLFDTTLRFAGDEVAAVAARSRAIAEAALRHIEVEYEPLPFVADLDSAAAADAPCVHADRPGNRTGDPDIQCRGDVERGLADAAVVVEAEYATQTALHNAFESHGCTALWEGERLTLWESTQGIFEVREQVANKLGLPEHHVRVIKQHMGGGFGAKQIAWKHSVIAALLSQMTGRPVQLVLDREAESLAAGNRNATRQRVTLGATREGRLTVISADIDVAIGAYAIGGESSNVAGSYHRLYECANVRTEQTSYFLNTGPSVAFRAPGYVEGAFALESAMDELARSLDLDPLELRRRNYALQDQQKDQPFTSPESLRLCYARGAEAFGWPPRKREPGARSRRRRGVGVAAHDWMAGMGHPPGYAWVKLNGDGSAEVTTGAQDIGTGTRTGLAQVAAEELGLPLEQVTVNLGDTARGPYAPVSAGSATQATLGPAIRQACADARDQLLVAAARLLDEDDAHTLEVHEGVIRAAGNTQRRITVAEVTGSIAPQMIQGHGARGPNPEGRTVRTCGVQFAEVEVDTETGDVTVLRIVASHDCGRIINPRLVDSQVLGGVTQGIGFALTEARVVDPASGRVLNANLEDYLVPTAADVPDVCHARLDLPDPEANCTGAKGIGEPPIIPTAPAIANAIFDAIGIRLRETPLTRQQILDALARQTRGEST